MIAGTLHPNARVRGMTAPPCIPDPVHGVVGEEGSPGHVSGVLEDGDDDVEEEDVRERYPKACLERE